MRILDAETAEGRRALRDRITATALLADAQGPTAIGDCLAHLAVQIESTSEDLSATLQSELLAAEAMLHDAGA